MFGPSYILFLIGSLMLITNSEIVYKMINLECLFNPKYMVNGYCKLKAVNWRKTEANIEADIVGVLRNVSVQIQGFIKNDANKYQPFQINVTNNFCDLVAKRIFPTIGVIILGYLKDFSNVNHSCPYMGHVYIQNLYLDPKRVPSIMPFGRYRAIYKFSEGYPYEDVGVITFHVDIMDLQPRQQRKKRPKIWSKSFD